MDIDKFRLLADVAETKNLTRSGERLGYSQSGVSHILKDLESKLGFPLFIRTKYGVKPTSNTELLLPLIRDILSGTERLEQTIDRVHGLETGTLVIGAYSSVSTHCLPPILHAFNTQYPHVEILLKEGGADDILQWIYGNMVDIGFFSRPRTYNFDWIPLGNDPLMAILPEDHPVGRGGAFPMSSFEGAAFIISSAGTDYDIHYALEACGVRPHIKYSSMDDHTIISMVVHRLGISILPKLILTNSTDGFIALPLQPAFERELGVGMRSRAGLSPAASKFVDFAKERFVLPD
jgi:DNA-binding transcriptional LysR family regulator